MVDYSPVDLKKLLQNSNDSVFAQLFRALHAACDHAIDSVGHGANSDVYKKIMPLAFAPYIENTSFRMQTDFDVEADIHGQMTSIGTLPMLVGLLIENKDFDDGYKELFGDVILPQNITALPILPIGFSSGKSNNPFPKRNVRDMATKAALLNAPVYALINLQFMMPRIFIPMSWQERITGVFVRPTVKKEIPTQDELIQKRNEISPPEIGSLPDGISLKNKPK